MATEEHLKAFKVTLEHLETVVAARKHVPKDDASFKGLESVIQNLASTLRLQNANILGDDAICQQDCPRLGELCGLLDDIPDAQKVVRVILLNLFQQVKSQEDPNSRDVSAQGNLLNIWRTLELEKIENQAVANAITRALVASYQTTTQSGQS